MNDTYYIILKKVSLIINLKFSYLEYSYKHTSYHQINQIKENHILYLIITVSLICLFHNINY